MSTMSVIYIHKVIPVIRFRLGCPKFKSCSLVPWGVFQVGVILWTIIILKAPVMTYKYYGVYPVGGDKQSGFLIQGCHSYTG